jgi:hypothetical protein
MKLPTAWSRRSFRTAVAPSMWCRPVVRGMSKRTISISKGTSSGESFLIIPGRCTGPVSESCTTRSLLRAGMGRILLFRDWTWISAVSQRGVSPGGAGGATRSPVEPAPRAGTRIFGLHRSGIYAGPGAAKREFETAVALDPNDRESHHWMSHYWISLKTVPGSGCRGSSRRGMQSAELSIGAHMAFTRYEEGRFPEAIDAAAATLQLDASHAPTNW